MITISVAKVPGRVSDFYLEDETTVKYALTVAEIKYEKCQVQVNGEDCSLSDELSDGDTVTVTGKIRGN